MTESPEEIIIREKHNSFKIIYKYNLNFKAICMNLAFMSFVFMVIWFVHLLQHQSIPFFIFPVICIAICASLYLTSISSTVIEINNNCISVCQKPLPKNSPPPIPLSDIDNVCYGPEPLGGIFRIYSLKIVLKNGKKISIFKSYPEGENHVKFIQSVLQKKLDLEERERKALTGI